MPNHQKIYLSSPHMGGNELEYIKQAFDSNWISPLGQNIDGFERDIKSYLNTDKQVAALNSGTAAIHLALVQLGVTFGDEIICQSFTFCGSVNPIIYQGAKPIFVDSEEDSWNICPNALEEAIKDRIKLGKTPKAIIAVHLYGMPYQVDAVHDIAERYGIPIIEDAAEALGSSYKGQACGTFGKFGAFSFNGNKIITTGGGGALVCDSKKDKHQTIFYATQARDEAYHYEHSHIGFNYRISNVLAGIGRGQMKVLHEHICLRRKVHNAYKHMFRDIEAIEVFEENNSDIFSNHWLTAITISEKARFNREDLRLALQEDNIESRPLWKPMHLQPVFKNLPYYGGSTAEKLFDVGLCLPSGSNITEEDLTRIEYNLNKFFKTHGLI